MALAEDYDNSENCGSHKLFQNLILANVKLPEVEQHRQELLIEQFIDDRVSECIAEGEFHVH